MSFLDHTNGNGDGGSGGWDERPPYDDAGPTPPNNLDAERSVLGAVLLSDTAMPALIIDVRLRPEDFYRRSHALIFEAMLALHTENQGIDTVTVSEQLESTGNLDAVGGRGAVDLLAGGVPAVGNVRDYARIVHDTAMLRRLLRASYEIQEHVHGRQGSPREIVDIAERTILEVGHDDSSKDFRAVGDVLHDEVGKLERLSTEGKAVTGTPSGFEDLDAITGGFQPGNLIILAARPSMGKCLAGDTLVLDPRDGSRRPIAELVAAHEAGQEVVIAALDHRLRFVPARISAAMRSGVQPVVSLRTRSGRSLRLTATHPLLTLRGWRKVSELRRGDRVAVPRVLAEDEIDAPPPAPPVEGAAGRAAAPQLGPGGETAPAAPPEARTLPRPIDAEPVAGIADLWWDAIDRIEPRGSAETYDLTVPVHHNFVAADLVVHNSALMANFAENAALGAEKAVALFSLEMSESELAQRFIASQASIKGDDLRKGRVPGSRWGRILEASGRLGQSPLYIDDSSDLSVLDVRAKARRLLQQNPDGLGLILIDYLQLMRADGRTDSRVEQIGQISRGLKTLARELEVPVIALSQLNRGVEQRTDKRPVLSDLRESGSIEQDADLVMFIYRDEYYDRESEREGIADLIISKHRNGGLGTVELTFQKEYPRFMSYVGDDRY